MFTKIIFTVAIVGFVQAAIQPLNQPAPPVLTSNLDPGYSFAYDVQDALTGNSKRQIENRNGDVVTGEYSLNDPDGTRRIVRYRADPINGFVAVVKKEPLVAAVPAVGVAQNPDAVAVEAADLEPQRYTTRQRLVVRPNNFDEERREPLDPQRAQTKNDPRKAKPAKLEIAPEEPQAAPIPVARVATNVFSAPYLSAPYLALPGYSAPFTYSTVTVF